MSEPGYLKCHFLTTIVGSPGNQKCRSPGPTPGCLNGIVTKFPGGLNVPPTLPQDTASSQGAAGSAQATAGRGWRGQLSQWGQEPEAQHQGMGGWLAAL